MLKVHPSNFVVSGFTSSVGIARARLAAHDPWSRTSAPVCSPPHPRLPDEPSAASALRAGADLVTASGDKLLGGPQCGLMLGRSDLVESLRRHPFARALRVDKLTLAALEATLTGPAAPVTAALAPLARELLARAEAIAERWRRTSSTSRPWRRRRPSGGGGAPGVPIDSAAVALPAHLAEPLRLDAEHPVVGRVERGRLLLDLIAVAPEDDALLVGAVRRAAAARQARASVDARRRHRGARRPRQVRAGQGAHGQRPRPARGGAPPGSVDPARLRLDRRCPRSGTSPSSTSRATNASSPRCWPGSGRCRPCCWSSPPTTRGCPRPPSTSPRSTLSGSRHGVVAVTRCDLADPGPAAARAAAEVRRTSLRGSPVVAVSSRTGAGLDELRARLVELVLGLPEADPDADVRLWVDRRFTVSGAGTVVTGHAAGRDGRSAATR